MHKIFLTGGSGMVGKNIQSHPESKKWIIFAPSRGILFETTIPFIGYLWENEI